MSICVFWVTVVLIWSLPTFLFFFGRWGGLVFYVYPCSEVLLMSEEICTMPLSLSPVQEHFDEISLFSWCTSRKLALFVSLLKIAVYLLGTWDIGCARGKEGSTGQSWTCRPDRRRRKLLPWKVSGIEELLFSLECKPTHKTFRKEFPENLQI